MLRTVGRFGSLLLLAALAACSSPSAPAEGVTASGVAAQMKAQGYGCSAVTTYAASNLELPRYASDGAKCSTDAGTLWIVTFKDNQARDSFRQTFKVGDQSTEVYTYGDRWVMEAGGPAALAPAAKALGGQVLRISAQ